MKRREKLSPCGGKVGVLVCEQGCGELGCPNCFARFFNGRDENEGKKKTTDREASTRVSTVTVPIARDTGESGNAKIEFAPLTSAIRR